MIQFLHSGCALLVGTADASGRPHGSRAWGLTVIDLDPVSVRLLVDSADVTTLANLQPDALVAITAASVTTLRSLQMKGRVVRREPATEVDENKRVQYTTDFTNDIHKTDGDPLVIVRAWADRSVVPCIVDVDAIFDQTPGPAAGAAMSGSPE